MRTVIYFDTSDPSDFGWAWRTSGESGRIDGASARALTEIIAGRPPLQEDLDLLEAEYPDGVLYDGEICVGLLFPADA